MGWIKKGAYIVDSTQGTKLKVTPSKMNALQPGKLMSEQQLARIADKIGAEAYNLLNQYREEQHLIESHWSRSLQETARVRAREILSLYQHVRPDGADALQAPYEFGYDRQSKVQREAMGKVDSDSLKWLIINGASTILEVLQNSIEHFLANDVSDEQALGVYILENDANYTMGFVYFGGQKEGNLIERRHAEEAKCQADLQKAAVHEKETADKIAENQKRLATFDKLQANPALTLVPSEKTEGPTGVPESPTSVAGHTNQERIEAATRSSEKPVATPPKPLIVGKAVVEPEPDLAETQVMDGSLIKATLEKLAKSAHPAEKQEGQADSPVPFSKAPEQQVADTEARQVPVPPVPKKRLSKDELRGKIATLYNNSNVLDALEYDPASWNQLMLAKSDAMLVYRDLGSSEHDAEIAVKELEQAMKNLHRL